MTRIIVSSIISSPLGPIHLATSNQGLLYCSFAKKVHEKKRLMEDGQEENIMKGKESTSDSKSALDLLHQTKLELREYFDGARHDFSIPVAPEGTVFQQSVWKALQDVPYGSTVSYQEIAAAVGNEKASRAVGRANNKNPISIIIPCHRVIGKDGKMVGYGGGLDKKELLLNLEGGSSKDVD